MYERRVPVPAVPVGGVTMCCSGLHGAGPCRPVLIGVRGWRRRLKFRQVSGRPQGRSLLMDRDAR